MQPQKEIWKMLQEIRLGSDKEKWDGLNLEHQNPAGIKRVLQASWEAKGCVDSKANDDGTIGHVEEVRITEPVLHLKKPAKAQPVELEFKYKKLQKFCPTCGSLQHGYDRCPKASTLSATAGALMEIGHDPFVTNKERRAAVEGLNSGQDLGESSGASQSLPLILHPISEYLMEQGFCQQAENSGAIAENDAVAITVEDVLMGGSSAQGTKRKVDETDMEIALPAQKKLMDYRED
ncbi:unnamed protein product [Arabis nemorensis]|uniref:Zinc knuckle CX2CX4HX4C domain-containing protein n=1 Tax=Arabis nemorensis TaxID=586526 RepID=A0A565CB29_9BRAS|nr:unnamed protein product [Arabis nemorensis]